MNKFLDQEVRVKPLTAADLAALEETKAASARFLEAGKKRAARISPEDAERYARKQQSAVG